MSYLIHDLSYLINIINRITGAMAIAPVRKGQLTQFGGGTQGPQWHPGASNRISQWYIYLEN
jgi:hypothetical protein